MTYLFGTVFGDEKIVETDDNNENDEVNQTVCFLALLYVGKIRFLSCVIMCVAI